MYKSVPAYEADHTGYEYVDPEDKCENCGHKYKKCECGDVIADDDPDAPLDEENYRR